MLIRPAELYPEGASAPARSLIDVRAPIEVARGAMPGSHALPLMSDAERHAVGIRYKEAGQEAAIALGYELAGPHLPERIEAWRSVCREGPAAVACWRGGLRSELALSFIDRGDVVRVEGGYKALRRHVMEALPRSLARKRMVVLTGLTGSGKTRLLDRLAGTRAELQVLDLEGEARHRGSAFGAVDVPQPSQQSFENALATQLLLSPAPELVVEDESRYVGRRTLPDDLMEAMRSAPLVVLETPMAERVSNIVEEYVLEAGQRHGPAAARERLEADTLRIRKRLGGGRTDAVVAALRAAETARAWFEPDAHRWWVQTLLEHYYDRLYRKAIGRHERPVVFRGDAAAVTSYLLGDAA
ncbi:MAG: tRNA 2-selenouridine(34) synthase MnmH [Deinococcales bacterium]